MTEKRHTIYYVGLNERLYIQYDHLKQEALPVHAGHSIPISEEKLADFFATAKLLGMQTGQL